MSDIQALRETIARLRSPGGCPWDIEQTHQSICDCLVEEVSELLDTIDRLDFEHMREELGDLLLHVVMHAQMAEEQGHFDLEAVAHDINEKLIRRHPHVFGHATLEDTSEVLVMWDKIKEGEKKKSPPVKGQFKHLPPSLPALLYAREVFKQIRKKELDAGDTIDSDYVNTLAEGLSEETAGRMLFELSAACREADIDPESALRRHTTRIVDGVNERMSSPKN